MNQECPKKKKKKKKKKIKFLKQQKKIFRGIPPFHGTLIPDKNK